ncbi:MAG: alpha/beta fold hydrolase [Polyangia bacterium]
MPAIEHDDHLIHYQTHGPEDAPPLLLIMGLALSSGAWDSLPARLQDRFRVIVYDNRGVGGSKRSRGWHRMRDYAGDAAVVLRAAGVEETGAFVFGISMGGMIAQELALQHPKLVRSLILGATHAGWRHSHKPDLEVLLSLVGANLLGPSAHPRIAPLLVSREFGRERRHELQRWLRAAGVGPPLAVLRQMAAILGHSTMHRLDRIHCPTLVVTGTDDRLVPAINSRILHARIPDARLVELPGAGHVFPLEREDETVQLLVEHFLGAR